MTTIGSPRRTRLAAACCLAVVYLTPAAMPDLMPPGRKQVRHELVLDWGAVPREQRFVASPIRGFHGSCEIHPGEPFPFSSKYGTRIYAVPSDAAVPPQERIAADCSWPSAAIPVREVASTAAGHPLARVESTLAVRAVRADGLELACTGQRRLDAMGNELGDLDWVPLAAIAGAGAWLVWRLSRRAPTTGAT